MQTYVVVSVDKSTKLTSSLDSIGGQNPTWNDKFVFHVPADFLASETSSVSVLFCRQRCSMVKSWRSRSRLPAADIEPSYEERKSCIESLHQQIAVAAAPVLFFITIAALILAVSSIVKSCPPSDRAALLAFKAALHEPYLGIFNSWTGTDCCNKWYGVSCDPETRRVADITLRGESEDPLFEKAHRTGHMTGTISPAICKLDKLSSIIIADWKGISGPIPACITSLPYLRILDLIGNQINGHIPEDIGKLSRLTVLNFADNNISGRIPRSLANLSSLMHLDLRNNKITGTIPRTIGKLRMMSRALLSGNRLFGPIPNSISFIYRLSDLDLSLNMISGPIPASLGKMAVLATLNLDGNKVTGTIPPTLINSSISILNLSRNAIEGNIPDLFGPKSYFMVMDLSYNRLKGPVPKSIGSASYIGHLDISHNHLCGAIPAAPWFDHLEASSFQFNDCLCGKPLKAC